MYPNKGDIPMNALTKPTTHFTTSIALDEIHLDFERYFFRIADLTNFICSKSFETFFF